MQGYSLSVSVMRQKILRSVGRFRWLSALRYGGLCQGIYKPLIPTHLKPTPRKTFLPHYWNTKNWHLFPEFFSAYYLETLSLTTACLFLSWSLGLFLFEENFHIEWVFRTPVNGTGAFSAFTAAYGMSESAHKM